AWLPATFAIWYFAAPILLWPAALLSDWAMRIGFAESAPILLWPAALLSDWAMRIGFADLVRAVDQVGAGIAFTTTLKPGESVAGGIVTAEVNMLLYSFGLPLFTALTLAAREPHRLRTLVIG